MRLIINREALIKGLRIVSKAIFPKSAQPVLSNVKLSLNEKGLELLGNDGDLTIRTIVPYMIAGKEIITNSQVGETLVNFKVFNEIVNKMEGESISIDLIDGITLRIDDGRSNFKLNSIRPEEYPDIDLELFGSIFDIDTSDLISLVETTAFSASTKAVRPVLMCINLEAKDNVLTATATDSARLAKKRVDLENNVSFSVNISAKKFLDIVHSFEDETTVTVAINDKRAIFSFGFTTISVRLVGVEYFNTKNIIPKNYNYTLEVNSRELLAVLDRLSIVTAEHDGIVKLIMSEDEVELASRAVNVGGGNEKLTTFQFSGEHLEISFKSSFVIDAVKALKSEDVLLSFVGEVKPFTIKNMKDDSVDMLVTPVRA